MILQVVLRGQLDLLEELKTKNRRKKNEETKLENKIDNKNEKINETLPVSTGKIETATQNLSSVSTTVEKPKEPEPNTATTTNTTTSNTSSDTGSSGSTTTEVPKSETTNNEKKVEGNKIMQLINTKNTCVFEKIIRLGEGQKLVISSIKLFSW